MKVRKGIKPSRGKERPSVTMFRIFNTIFMGVTALTCVVLLLHVVALSLRDRKSVV